MTNPGPPSPPSLISPFHRGEQSIQERVGVRAQAEALGRRFIRNHMPGEHREFYEELPYLMLGTVDAAGRPWASILTGEPGFLQAPDRSTLRIDAHPLPGDPAAQNLAPGAQAGLLGILFHARRRNRMNGHVTRADAGGVTIEVDQSFGNCPMYIQAREHAPLPVEERAPGALARRLDHLDHRARQLIAGSDSFFIASQFAEGDGRASDGVDVSHRGGRPGFVRVDDERTLTFPDFSGNRHFNTLGNLLLNPRAGLLFLDFETRDLLLLTGRTEILWEDEEIDAFVGAERGVRFHLEEGHFLPAALPLRFEYRDASPVLEQTGSWEEVAAVLEARRSGNPLREYRVAAVVRESATIRSFHLVPADGESPPCHEPGQFLPLEIHPTGADGPVHRTYTISNAPDGERLRLSIKRELAPSEDLAPGLVSNHFHDSIQIGSTLRALAPRGSFVLDAESPRPIVLLSAGVGVTPMIAMLEHLVESTASCGEARRIWFVHGARNGAEHAFGSHVRNLAARCAALTAHISYSQPREEDALGRDHDRVGRVDVALLRELLPFDDHDFYLCGPQGWIEAMHEGLRGLSVPQERIRYEFFGPATALGSSGRVVEGSLPTGVGPEPVAVRFARSGLDALWDPTRGTLLDLAESEGLTPAFSCRSGICQSCSTRVASGEVRYGDSPMTPPAEGEALICCAYPASTGGPLLLDL